MPCFQGSRFTTITNTFISFQFIYKPFYYWVRTFKSVFYGLLGDFKSAYPLQYLFFIFINYAFSMIVLGNLNSFFNVFNNFSNCPQSYPTILAIPLPYITNDGDLIILIPRAPGFEHICSDAPNRVVKNFPLLNCQTNFKHSTFFIHGINNVNISQNKFFVLLLVIFM